MPSLATQVEHLVEITLDHKKVKDAELGTALQSVLGAYDSNDRSGIKAAIRRLDAALLETDDGWAGQILRLALGVLVEAGAPAELAWPTAERDLIGTLKAARRFSRACRNAGDAASVADAVAVAGRRIARKLPREQLAWESLKSRALLAVACVSHSAKLRAQIQRSRHDLLDAVRPLEEEVEALLFLSQIMRVLPDQTMLAIHPGQRRGFRVEVREVTTNLELFVLLADTIVGDPKKGFIDGRRPSKKAIAALTDPDRAPSTPPEVSLSWHLSTWRALRRDGTLADEGEQRPEDKIGFEGGVPHDIPPFEGERVILFAKPMMRHTRRIEASFEALAPRVTLKSKLSGGEIDRLLAKMGRAAAKPARKR